VDKCELGKELFCATRYTSHVTRHTSHVTRHTSHVTRHTPPTPQIRQVIPIPRRALGGFTSPAIPTIAQDRAIAAADTGADFTRSNAAEEAAGDPGTQKPRGSTCGLCVMC
jgi:hypothetical protein